MNDTTEIQKLKLAVKELSVLNDIAVAVSSTHDLNQVIELIFFFKLLIRNEINQDQIKISIYQKVFTSYRMNFSSYRIKD